MANIKVLFGKKIKEYRLKRKLTQTQLAELVSVDNKHISCIESGKSFPSPDLIDRLAITLNVKPKDLFEFYHLQEKTDLKTDIINMIKNLDEKELSMVYKFIYNFLIK